jgi:hypothetical protein
VIDSGSANGRLQEGAKVDCGSMVKVTLPESFGPPHHLKGHRELQQGREGNKMAQHNIKLYWTVVLQGVSRRSQVPCRSHSRSNFRPGMPETGLWIRLCSWGTDEAIPGVRIAGESRFGQPMETRSGRCCRRLKKRVTSREEETGRFLHRGVSGSGGPHVRRLRAQWANEGKLQSASGPSWLNFVRDPTHLACADMRPARCPMA